MRIKNSFDEREISFLAGQIYCLIKKEPGLSNRNLSKIKNWLRKGYLFVALENNQVMGFIAREKLTGNFYKLKSWFVNRKLRGKDLGKKLFIEAIKDKNINYLAFTFQGKIVKKLQKFGFEKIYLRKLPINVLLKLAIDWEFSSLFKHLFKHKYLFKKSNTLLIKRCQ